MNRPFRFRCHFDGTTLVPDARTLDYCKRELGEGEVIILERNEERSEGSHRHYFAFLNESFLNLPERLSDEYPTVDALRAKALIHSGYYHERHVTCESEKEAATIAAFIQPMNQYSVVSVRGCVIQVFTAKSQSRKAMNKKEFQESKDKVMDYVSNLIGLSPKELQRNSGKAA